MHVQIDILARSPRDGLLTVVEVKMRTGSEGSLQYKQHIRLRRVCEFLSQFEPVQLMIAHVRGWDVSLVPLDRLTPGG
jgi:Holliday junction resolvase-like predicted endonuclease